MDYHDIVINFTKECATKVIGDCSDLQIEFSRRLRKPCGLCYPYRKLIVYNDNYMNLNKDNIEILKYTIIEECAHLRYIDHNQNFYDLCIELGCDVRKPPIGIKYFWKYYKHCDDCGNGKYYYKETPNMVCRKCGGNMKIIERID